MHWKHKATIQNVIGGLPANLGNRSERGSERFERGHFEEATRLFDELVRSESLAEFLTLKAYELLD